MKKENLSSRALEHLQRGTASKESHDGFAALAGVWWALRRVKRSEREMIEAVEHMIQIEEAIAANRTREKSSASETRFGKACSASPSTAFSAQRQTGTTDRDGLLKYSCCFCSHC